MQLSNIGAAAAAQGRPSEPPAAIPEVVLLATMAHRQASAREMQMQACMQQMALEMERIDKKHAEQVDTLSRSLQEMEGRIIQLQGSLKTCETLRQSENVAAQQNRGELEAQVASASQIMAALKEQMHSELASLRGEKNTACRQVAELQICKVAAEQTIQQQANEINALRHSLATQQEHSNREIARLTSEKVTACQQVADLQAQMLVAEQQRLQCQEEARAANQLVVTKQNYITMQERQLVDLQTQIRLSELRRQQSQTEASEANYLATTKQCYINSLEQRITQLAVHVPMQPMERWENWISDLEFLNRAQHEGIAYLNARLERGDVAALVIQNAVLEPIVQLVQKLTSIACEADWIRQLMGLPPSSVTGFFSSMRTTTPAEQFSLLRLQKDLPTEKRWHTWLPLLARQYRDQHEGIVGLHIHIKKEQVAVVLNSNEELKPIIGLVDQLMYAASGAEWLRKLMGLQPSCVAEYLATYEAEWTMRAMGPPASSGVRV